MSSTHRRRWTGPRCIWFGVSAPIVFCLAMLMFGALTPGYSHRDQALSELGMRTAPYALAWNIFGFGVLGVQLALFAAGFFAATRARLAAALITLTAVGFIGAGAIPADPAFEPSAQTSLHIGMASLSYFPFIIAALLFGFTHIRAPGWRSAAVLSLGLAGLAVASFLLPRSVPAGLAQRVGFLIYFAWLAAMTVASRGQPALQTPK